MGLGSFEMSTKEFAGWHGNASLSLCADVA